MPPTTSAIAGSVATITLDNPEKHNALTPELLNSLGQDLQAVANDQSVRVVVITNSGPTFCAGANLGANADVTPAHDLVAVLRLIQEMEKPVVARIAGRCLGGGVGLAAACDISIAVSSARFGFSEVRLGVAPAIISVVCLAKLRAVDAAELFLTGEQFDAERAVAVGLIARAQSNPKRWMMPSPRPSTACCLAPPAPSPPPNGCYCMFRGWRTTRPSTGRGRCRPPCLPPPRRRRGSPPSVPADQRRGCPSNSDRMDRPALLHRIPVGRVRA